MKLTSQWGLYPWFEERGANLVHPDDLDDFRKLMPYGKVFFCQSKNEFLVLRYQNSHYRVRPQLFSEVPAPEFTFGQLVHVRETGDPAQIDEIHWHHQRAKPIFFVTFGGRRNKKRFWADDLAETSE